MTKKPKKRFIFIGGVPVFDYMIPVRMEDINRATQNNVFVVGSRILLPLGTVFEVEAPEMNRTMYINPMANVDLQYLHDKPYYAMELGGKHPEQHNYSLEGEKKVVFEELNRSFPEMIKSEDDLKIVKASEEVQLHLGGNNKNIIEEIKELYLSPELAGLVEDIGFEHRFFFDTRHPKFKMVDDLYRRLGVSVGNVEDLHVEGLLPRVSYVLTVSAEDGKAMDRIILSNKTNEDIIPIEQINNVYFALEYKLRKDVSFVETHLVVSSLTNQEEIRLLARLLHTAHASGVKTYLCPTLTLLKGVDRLVESKYYAIEKERFYQYRQDFIYSAVIPYVKCLILNRDELALLDNAVAKRGVDATATFLAHQMDRGRKGEGDGGGRVVVTGGSQGARYTEILRPDRAILFWTKAKFAPDKEVRFADRRIICGDDYLTGFTSTLGAGDVFTGIFIGLNAIDWDGGHALRAATLGAQHFIQHRRHPRIHDMVAMDETHIRLGTETELVDVISHHVSDSGDPTRYGTIADTVITVTTTQIQHPFREILALEDSFAKAKAK